MEAVNLKQPPRSGKKKSMHKDQLVFLHAKFILKAKLACHLKQQEQLSAFLSFPSLLRMATWLKSNHLLQAWLLPH